MNYRGRFAPSPSGPLHFGSLVAALASWLDARAAGGEWLVRMEDVDTPRTVTGAEDAILRALEAFGLHWDGPVVRQSERTALYGAALERLRERGLVYRCKCSRKEIADSAMASVEGIEGVVYPGTCRHRALGLDVDGADRILSAGEAIAFTDRAQGPVSQRIAQDVGDFVLKRRDGLFAYQLAVVVDDADQGITDIVRGADLLLSTPRQVFLQRVLGYPTPRYLHIPVATRDGQKLSKQNRAPALDAKAATRLLGQGLAFLGQPVPRSGDPRELLAAATRDWDPARIPGTPAAEIHNM
ncbi:Glutamyl-Q tRNA(Asp) synthetase [Usitatibacter rugosus]|uniref:Glutamyl-Q tRNA(Asp) synthetase n=1 Tax=Usitatibacter rugosus TaxID=2732067 RepID=A0A6M4GZR0_9PROT|nr:tRNA glutamyl-Q(34) synthetase GluQRS [Usitatibacter rugosus]QJR12348.1 Glutamyl-Q tRNA(Asp) synthetase [Usitatibacter rugosus]